MTSLLYGNLFVLLGVQSSRGVHGLQEWANRSSEDKREKFGSRVREVACALAVKKGDIIVMPLKRKGGVAISRVLSEHIEHSDSEELYAKDMSNYFNVEWLTQFYNRTGLPAEIQSILKYRRSILNIDYYQAEFKSLLKIRVFECLCRLIRLKTAIFTGGSASLLLQNCHLMQQMAL